MALVERWLRTSNDSPAIVALFGAPVAAGGGAGTQPSPWALWSSATTLISDVATDHSADDLVIHCHPAAYTLITASLQYTNRGWVANSWKSITIKRDETVVGGDARWADFWPSWDRQKGATGWTQGSIVNNVFTPGAGDVYRASLGTISPGYSYAFTASITGTTMTVTSVSGTPLQIGQQVVGAGVTAGTSIRALGTANGGTGTYIVDISQTVSSISMTAYWWKVDTLRFYAGVDRKNTNCPRPQTLIWAQTAEMMTEAGDFTCVGTSATTVDVLVKTGVVGQSPEVRWGNEVTFSDYSASTIWLFWGGRNITVQDCQAIGGQFRFFTQNNGEYLLNCGYIRCRNRMSTNNCNGLETGSAVYDTWGEDLFNLEPNNDAYEMAKRVKATTGYTGAGGQNGLRVANRVNRVLITNPISAGASHGQTSFEMASNLVINSNIAAAANGVFTGTWFVIRPNDNVPHTSPHAVRSMLIEITGTFNATVTLQTSTTSDTGPWTDVKSWTGPASEVYNDRLSDNRWYRVGTTAYTSGTANVRLRAAPWPRNIEIRVTSYENGKSTLTGAYDTSDPQTTSNYQRGLGAGGINTVIGPLKVRNQTVQSQFSGTARVRGIHYDKTCKPYNDNPGGGNTNTGYGLGSHMNYGTGPWVYDYPQEQLKITGSKHDLVGNIGIYWDRDAVLDSLQILGSLFRDSGAVRYITNEDLAQSIYTRRRTPIYGESNNATPPQYQIVRGGMFILDPACEGMLQHRFGGTNYANGSAANLPVIAVGATQSAENASVNYTSARLSGNVSGTEASFGFDADLNYIGPRRTPVQNGPRRGRGYR